MPSDTLNDLHVVDVESTDGVTAVISLLKHLGSSDQWHIYHSFSKLAIYILPLKINKNKSLMRYLNREIQNHEKVCKTEILTSQIEHFDCDFFTCLLPFARCNIKHRPPSGDRCNF